jgi:Collagen triple helix repeat (20 copies)
MLKTAKHFAAALVFAVFVSSPCLFAQAPASDDISSNWNAGLGQLPFLVVGAPSTNTYIRFDLSHLPAGTTGEKVRKATVRLFVNEVTSPGSFAVQRVTSAWTEDNFSSQTQPSLGSTEISNVALSRQSEENYLILDITSLVKDWLNQVQPNYGIALVPNGNISATFDSKENIQTSHDPQLNIVLADVGQQGPPGVQGPQGLQGVPGPAGTAGPQGLKGDTGAQGPVGATGPAGPQGAQGDTGATGAIGPQGPAGAAGPAGPQGPPGLQGLQGSTGPAGPSGADGASGAQGPAGPQGPPGPASVGAVSQLTWGSGTTAFGQTVFPSNQTFTGFKHIKIRAIFKRTSTSTNFSLHISSDGVRSYSFACQSDGNLVMYYNDGSTQAVLYSPNIFTSDIAGYNYVEFELSPLAPSVTQMWGQINSYRMVPNGAGDTFADMDLSTGTFTIYAGIDSSANLVNAFVETW